MKLTNINQTLEEAIKFTNKELRLVKQEAKDILVGIEYEYHVNDCDDVDGEPTSEFNDAVSDRAHELFDQAIDGKREEIIDEIVENDMNEFNVESITALLNSIKVKISSNEFDVLRNYFLNESDDIENILMGIDIEEGIEDDELEQVKEFYSNYQKFKPMMEDIKNEADSIEVDEQLDRISYYLPGNGQDIEDNWDEFKDNLDYLVEDIDGYDMDDNDDLTSFYSDIVENVNSVISFVDDMFDNISSLQGTDGDWDDAVREGFKDLAEDLWESEKTSFLGFDPDESIHAQDPNDRYNRSFWEIAYEEIQDEGDIQQYESDCTHTIENELDDLDLMQYIETVKTDPSVSKGVEVITKPLPLEKAMDVMEDMFEHISDVGSTSSSTGMHVNMSIRGLHFSKRDFNPIKLLMLVDHKTLNDLFPVRGYIGTVIEPLNYKEIIRVASSPTNDIVKHFHERVSLSKKYQNINFNHIEASSVENRRIEFRYFGGDDYEQRYDTIKNEIYRVAYALMATFSDGFAENEYLKAIVKELNGYIKNNSLFVEAGIKDFFDLRSFCKKHNVSGNLTDHDIEFVVNLLLEEAAKK